MNKGFTFISILACFFTIFSPKAYSLDYYLWNNDERHSGREAQGAVIRSVISGILIYGTSYFTITKCSTVNSRVMRGLCRVVGVLSTAYVGEFTWSSAALAAVPPTNSMNLEATPEFQRIMNELNENERRLLTDIERDVEAGNRLEDVIASYRNDSANTESLARIEALIRASLQ